MTLLHYWLLGLVPAEQLGVLLIELAQQLVNPLTIPAGRVLLLEAIQHVLNILVLFQEHFEQVLDVDRSHGTKKLNTTAVFSVSFSESERSILFLGKSVNKRWLTIIHRLSPALGTTSGDAWGITRPARLRGRF